MQKICFPVFGIALFASLLATPAPALAAVCAVPGTYLTIQSAINDAACSTIQIAAGTFNEQLYIGRPVILQGAGAGLTILDGSNSGSVIRIQDNGTGMAVTISGVTVQHGFATFGGGISSYGATVQLIASRVANNVSDFQGAGILTDYGVMGSTWSIVDSTIADNTMAYNDGAGIRNHGLMTIRNSTISGNTTGSGFGGGIAHSGHLIIVNSTLANNSGSYGGAIGSDGLVEVSASTFTGNSSTGPYGGGAILNFSVTNAKNSVFADSPAGNNYTSIGGGSLSGVNFSTDGVTPGFTVVTSAQLNLGALGANGGPTATHVPGAGSVLIDAVTDCTEIGGAPVTADQRGVARPQGAACDAGAVEVAPVAPPTPAEVVTSLAGTIGSLGLDPGTTGALTSKLSAAVASLANGNNNAASGQLGAFVNQVKALVKSGRLSSANGAALTAAANAVVASL